MGNKLGRKREAVGDKYTKPQGLYEHKDVDHKKLRKLILDSKLAPCYPGDDDTDSDLEECPICFLYYPSLNRSRCCAKGICTECFLQMKTPNSGRPTQCPFCKTSNYAVEYRGMKTKEEKSIEQIEEQRVIEANIRMRQQELQDEEERMQKQNYIRSSRRSIRSGEMECGSKTESSSAVEGEEIVSSQHVCVAQSIRQPLLHRQNREYINTLVVEAIVNLSNAEREWRLIYDLLLYLGPVGEDEFDLELEDVMVMEAIWLSIQGNDSHHYQISEDAAPLEQSISEYRSFSASLLPLAETATSSSSPSGGLACAIAALAERQQVTGDSSSNRNSLTHNMPPVYNNFSNTSKQVPSNYPNPSSIQVTPNTRDEWVAGVGASYAGSDAAEVSGMNSNTFAQHDGNGSSNSQTVPGGAVVPESFEEQMMLAMAVSLAEAQPWNNSAEVAWP